MKNAILIFVSIIIFGSNFSANLVEELPHVILKINNLSKVQNLEIHDLFSNDTKVNLVNSCQQLGLLVFESKEGVRISSLEIEAYLKVKLAKVNDRNQSMIFPSGMSKDKVNQDCRKEVARIHNSNN